MRDFYHRLSNDIFLKQRSLLRALYRLVDSMMPRRAFYTVNLLDFIVTSVGLHATAVAVNP